MESGFYPVGGLFTLPVGGRTPAQQGRTRPSSPVSLSRLFTRIKAGFSLA